MDIFSFYIKFTNVRNLAEVILWFFMFPEQCFIHVLTEVLRLLKGTHIISTISKIKHDYTAARVDSPDDKDVPRHPGPKMGYLQEIDIPPRDRKDFLVSSGRRYFDEDGVGFFRVKSRNEDKGIRHRRCLRECRFWGF